LNFENSSASALSGWGVTAGAISISLESTKAGEHSLFYSGAGELNWKAKSDTASAVGLTAGESYSLSFWAKGQVAGDRDLKITFPYIIKLTN